VRIPPCLLVVGLLCAGAAAEAGTLGYDPASPGDEVPLGALVSVRLSYSDHGDSSAPPIGTFDLDVLYDPAILGFAGVVFGDPDLGDQLDLSGAGSLTEVDASVAGSVNLFQLSVDSPAELALQAGSFTLATLTFEALGLGASVLSVSDLILGDPLGDPIGGFSLVTRTLTVVPEPAPAALALFGTLLLALARRLGAGAPLRAPPA
jgi:hypothetical protein